VLVSLDAFQQIDHGSLLDLIKIFTYFLSQLRHDLVSPASRVNTLVMSEAFKQTRSYLRWELVKLFVLNQVLGQLIKERRVANHMNVLCAQFFEYLLNLVYGFDESWVVNSFFYSFNNSQ